MTGAITGNPLRCIRPGEQAAVCLHLHSVRIDTMRGQIGRLMSVRKTSQQEQRTCLS